LEVIYIWNKIRFAFVTKGTARRLFVKHGLASVLFLEIENALPSLEQQGGYAEAVP
jgi:hypothetical protein